MGLSCPVCGDPQADAAHLANHLAITALTRGGDHERWLDEHVSEWDSLSETELAEQVEDLAEKAEYPTVFEDTTGQEPSSSCGHSHAHTGETSNHTGSQQEKRTTQRDSLPEGAEMLAGEIDGDETAEAIKEAMEMTRKRRESEDADSDSSTVESETE